ncbi:MAG: cytochrome c [Gammaproteobacteria bacterium]
MRKILVAMFTGLALAAGGAPATASDAARQSYLLHCAGCHLPDGSGSTPNDVPTLHGIPGHFAKIPEGRAFLTQVPGIAYSPLGNAEVAEILNWMLREFSKDTLPADFVPFTVAEVTRLRETRPAEIFKVRAAVLARLRELGVVIEY